MMRRLSYALLALCFLVACNKEEEQLQAQWDGPVIELDLSCTGPDDPTKAGSNGTEAGENTFHENVISWVDFYFYPDGKTAEQASFHIRKESGKRDRDVFRLELTTNQVNYRIFPVSSNTTEALVFAIANGNKDMLDTLNNTSLDYIKQLVDTTEFVNVDLTRHRQERFMMSGETTITLAGRNQKVVSQGAVDLVRYACKITVSIKTGEKVTVPHATKIDEEGNPIQVVWTPRPKQMKVYLVDGVKNVALNGYPINQGGAPVPKYHNYVDNPMTFWDEGSGTWYFDKSGDFYNTFPMYTYPYHWLTGSGEEGTREPYLKLVLTWDRQPDPENGIDPDQKEFYYKILLPHDRRGEGFAESFVRNNWYHYDVEVGVLGADTDEAEVPLNASAYVVYWQNKDVVVSQANIGNARYLSLEQDTYELHNLDTLVAPYVTSHTIDFEVCSVTRPYFGTLTSGTDDTLGGDVIKCEANAPKELCHVGKKIIYDTDIYSPDSYYLSYSESQRMLLNGGKDWFENGNRVIKMNHPLKNDYTLSTFDYSPYTMFVGLWHHNDSNKEFPQILKVIQYPAVYISAELNSDPILPGSPGGNVDQENNKSAWKSFANNGYVFIDGDRRLRHPLDAQGKETKGEFDFLLSEMNKVGSGSYTEATGRPYLQWIQWRTVNFTGGNRNMYNISVTVLPDDSMVIGDPRTTVIDTLNNGVGEKGYNGVENFGEVSEGVYAFGYEPSFSKGTPMVGGASRKLRYYHPADASERTRNMISPGFRVASKFGGMEYGKADQMSAARKCATYQEDGYPAGRWRLPTMAEISFITSLQAHNTFVILFGKNGVYWSAHGAVQVLQGNIKEVKDKEAMARCVYDSWYWDSIGKDANGQSLSRLPAGDRNRYVLGDMPLPGDEE